MARTDLKVIVDAEVKRAEEGLERVRRSTHRLEDQLSKAALAAAELDRHLEQEAAKAAQERADAMETLGKGLLTFGAATLTGLGLAVKAAIDWESAWTGVKKTVEGSDAELEKLENELRDLATTLPASHQEIAAVAEAAGQLGVKTKDVSKFTRVMIDLGETTNLTAEDAATAIAQISNVMGTAGGDVDRFASTLVDLGNNGASTEREILEMAQRIAGAGSTVGLAESDVLGFANALASVGIEAEAGGTAISTVMIKIADSVASGGEQLDGFARVAGMSARDFARAFKSDPAGAIEAFVSGLHRIDASGGNVFGTLKDLELGEIRVRDALLRLSNGGDLLSESLSRGAQAWEENNALAEEAAKRYDTADAKIHIAQNALVDAAIDIGSIVLPALSGLAEMAAGALEWFSKLPGPVKTVATVFGTLIGLAAFLGGGFLLLAPRLAAVQTQMALLTVTAPRLAMAMRIMTLSIPVVGVLLAVAAGIAAIAASSQEAEKPVGEVTRALLRLRDGLPSKAMNELRDSFKDMKREAAANEALRDSQHQWQRSSVALEDFTKKMKSADGAIASLVESGHTKQAAEVVTALHKEFGRGGETVQQFAGRWLPGYVEALKKTQNEQQLAKESAGLLDEGLSKLAARFGLTGEEAEKSAQDMLGAWSEAFTDFVDLQGAFDVVMEAMNQAEREKAEKTAENTKSTKDSWQDYVGNVKASAKDYIKELKKMVQAQENWATNMIALSGKIPPAMLDELAQLGPKGAEQVELLANMSDRELREVVGLYNRRGKASGDSFADSLSTAGELWPAIARKHGKKTADRLIAEVASGKRSWDSVLSEYGHLINRRIPSKKQITIEAKNAITAAKARDIVRHLERLLPKALFIPVKAGKPPRGSSGGTYARAGGGRVWPGMWSWVGEQGRELVQFDAPGRVYSHAESVRMVNDTPASSTAVVPRQSTATSVTAGGTTVTNNIQTIPMDPPSVAREITRYIEWAGAS